MRSEQQELKSHMWVHRKKIYTCEICGVPFSGVKPLDEHRLAMHPSKAPFTCLQCGKCFMSKQGLTEHSRLHKGWSEQYFCSYCHKYFSSRQGYTIHGRIHTGERPYGCKYCPKFFRDGGTLKKHERIHTGERPHECPLCHKRYNQKVVLREHIRGVHVMKRNSDITSACPICNISNMGKDELSEHIVRHSDELMKKVKQEFMMKQRGMLKMDNSSRRRRSRKGKVNENSLKDLEGNGEVTEPDYEYSPKVQKTQDENPGTKRRAKNVRPLEKKEVISKRADRYKAKKKQRKTTVRKKPIKKKQKVDEIDTKPVNDVETDGNDAFVDDGVEEVINLEDNEKHVDVLPEDMTEECEMCHAKFSTRSDLVAHVFVHI